MTAKYDQLKNNLKHFTETYSPGILTATLDAARLAIIDLQEEKMSGDEKQEGDIKFQSEIIYILESSLKSISNNTKDSSSFAAAQSALNQVENKKKEEQYAKTLLPHMDASR